jgi:hypothetical protein
VIPQYTNWPRYVAFMRIIIIGIITEFRGELVDISAGDEVLGYSVDQVLAQLFRGTVGHADMAREYKTFLLITGDKTSTRRSGMLFQHYIAALGSSPQTWFRLRDCDALARFTIAAALACNDLDNVWYTEAQFDILCEVGDTMYDAIAFYKHRAEGETNSTFAYLPESTRVDGFRLARELLWALDTAYAHRPEHQVVMNFVRFFGGPIHMLMRRYRFVEEQLTVGHPDDRAVVEQTRRNFKLWNRIDDDDDDDRAADRAADPARYAALLAREHDLMFPGLADALRRGVACAACVARTRASTRTFGGVQLCAACRMQWRAFHETLPLRAKRAFPEIDLEPALPEARSPRGGGGGGSPKRQRRVDSPMRGGCDWD